MITKGLRFWNDDENLIIMTIIISDVFKGVFGDDPLPSLNPRNFFNPAFTRQPYNKVVYTVHTSKLFICRKISFLQKARYEESFKLNYI